MIHKQNLIKKAIEELKRGNAKQPTLEPAQVFIERERAFGRAYRSYRVNGCCMVVEAAILTLASFQCRNI